MRRALCILALACPVSCADTVVDANGQVLVYVDTDVAVPGLVSRLRVDLYTPQGTWYASRDFSLAHPADWPASFGAFTEGDEQVALVRLRAYPEGGTRDYRGERFFPRPARDETELALVEPPLPPPSGEPRLRDPSGADATPRQEPSPYVTIDRLLRVRVQRGDLGAVRVVLRGECFGTMADIARGASCIDREGILVAAADEPIGPDRARPASTAVGTFRPTGPCTAPPRGPSPLFDDEVCVDGATYRMGSIEGIFGNVEDLPERVVVLSPFRVDRWEVTVARWRAAVAAGFSSPDETPIENDGPLGKDELEAGGQTVSSCAFSTTPRDRESYALNCVTQRAARAFCRFAGGDIISEAQWEYVATLAGRPARSRYAWGGDDDEAPSCARAVWGRGSTARGQYCHATGGFGPRPVDSHAGPDQDVTPLFGVVGLGGGVAEVTRDVPARLSATCWAAAGLRDPACDVPHPLHVVRGASWRDNVGSLFATTRRYDITWDAGSGFRCVRGGER